MGVHGVSFSLTRWIPGRGEIVCAIAQILPFGDPGEQVDEGLVRLPSLRREARKDVAEVGTVERRALVDPSREENRGRASGTRCRSCGPDFGAGTTLATLASLIDGAIAVLISRSTTQVSWS